MIDPDDNMSDVLCAEHIFCAPQSACTDAPPVRPVRGKMETGRSLKG